MSNLAKQLDTELKGTIAAFFDEKTSEFSNLMKRRMEEVVDKKIKEFYTGTMDSELFDSTVTVIRPEYPSLPEATYIGQKCFRLDFYGHRDNQGRISESRNVVFVLADTFIRCSWINSGMHSAYDRFDYACVKHTITDPAMLRTMKHFQFGNMHGNELPSSPTKHQLRHNPTLRNPPPRKYEPMFQGLELYNDSPTYFMPHCVEFETTCKKEYAEIQQQKKFLEVKKKEHFETLEQQIKGLEERERQLKVGCEKLHDDKQKLRIVKQQLDTRASELQREREHFHAEKIAHASIDMDEFLKE